MFGQWTWGEDGIVPKKKKQIKAQDFKISHASIIS